MFSIFYCKYFFLKKNYVFTYSSFFRSYLLFLNYKYFYKYCSLLSYLKCGNRLLIDKHVFASFQVVLYEIQWSERLLINIGYIFEYIMRFYLLCINSIYKTTLCKLERKAGTRRMVYKKHNYISIFLKRLESGVFFLRTHSKNTMFYSFLSFLVFFHFIILFNFRFTVLYLQRTNKLSTDVDLNYSVRKRVYKQVYWFKRWKKLIM